MQNIKINKISKISPSRIGEHPETHKDFNIGSFGISKKCQGEGITICILGSGLPSHDKLPKASIFENFTEEKDPMIDVINFSTIGAGLISGDGFGLLPDAEVVFPKIIDNKGNITLSSLMSGLLWACIKQVNVLVLPCSIQNEFMSDLNSILKKVKAMGIIVIMPVDKNEESLEILNTDFVLGVKAGLSKEDNWSIIEEKKNLMTVCYPKGMKITSTHGAYKYARLLSRESLPFIASSFVGAICSRRKKKRLSLAYKDVYPEIVSLGSVKK